MGRALSELADLVGGDGEALTLFAGAGGLDGFVAYWPDLDGSILHKGWRASSVRPSTGSAIHAPAEVQTGAPGVEERTLPF